MKYQFCIRFDNVDVNSAASKAVLDCNKIFHECGYQDYTFTVGNNSRKFTYYVSLFRQLVIFFISIKRRSLIGIQYPLLSINNVFGYFMKLARLKGVKFFCIVHDLESLRTGGSDALLIKKEVRNLNYYDNLIIHNEFMEQWLIQAGVTAHMIRLHMFDYLSDAPLRQHGPGDHIVFAGNLVKSSFVNDLALIGTKEFNLYGPGYDDRVNKVNVHWRGQYHPDEIVAKLEGSYGLIWDGSTINSCEGPLGNYLRYNNPHKGSLYIAAGLPIIAPANSAIATFLKKENIGITVNNLKDLDDVLPGVNYGQMLANVAVIRENIINGGYFKSALELIEQRHV